MQAKWQGIEMLEVYVDWADALSECSLGAINDAIRMSRIEQHPPNQGEFLYYCQQYRPPIDRSRMIGYDKNSGYVGPSISREDGLKMLEEIKKKIADKMTELTKGG
jgi:hypothetical protein